MSKIFVFLASIFFVIGQIFLIPKNQTLQSQEVNVQSEQEQEELEILEEDENLEEDDLVQEDIQDQPDQNLNLENDEDIEKVVVSSDRLKQKSKELTAAHTIITRDEIEQSGAQTLEDIIQAAPGTYIASVAGKGTKNIVSIRGAGTSGSVLYLIDGLSINNESSYFPAEDIPAENIERIEIIRGNQTAIYGGQAVSGVINIITRKGKLGAHILGHGAFGMHSMHDLGLGFIGAGATEDGQGYRVFAYSRYSRADGVKNINDQTGLKTISLASEFTFSKYSKLNLYGNYIDKYYEYPPGPNYAFGPKQKMIIEKGDFENKTLSLLGMSYRHLLFDFYEPMIDVRYLVDTRNFKYAIFNPAFKGSSLLLNFKNNLYLFEKKNVLALGFEYQFDELYLKTDKYGKNRNKKTIYANNLLRLSGLTVSLAARVDFWESLYQKKDWNKSLFHWKGGLAYQVINDPKASISLIKPFFNISQGEIAPSLRGLAGGRSSDLKPVNIFVFDAGLQTSFFQDRVALTAAFFYHDFDNKIQYTRNPNPKPGEFQFIAFNVDQKSQGIELETKASFGYGFVLQGSYTYQDIKFPSYSFQGKKVIGVDKLPENAFKVILNWNGWKPLNVNATFISIGRRNYSKDADNPLYLASYELVNLAVSYQIIQELKAFFRIDNLLDKEYKSYNFDKIDSYGFNIWGGIKFKFSLL